jgi:3',5'-cyclic-AMP phosphodiesterase
VSTDAPRDGPWVFGVDVDCVQLTWRHVGAGPVEVRATATDAPDAPVIHRFDTQDGPGSAQIRGLPAGRQLSVVFDAPSRGRWRRTVRTLVPPPGPELFRFATISDLHLGEERFGFLGRMSEGAGHLEPYTVRAARAAVDEIEEWGAQLLVAKGDLTDSGRLADWDQFAAITARRGFPVLAILGNHDTWEPSHSMVHPRRPPPTDTDSPRLSPAEGLARLGLGHDPIAVRDEPGVRIVAVDTTRPDSRSGRIAHLADDVVDTVAASPAPAVVILHHQLMTSPVPTHLPIGIAQNEADPFLDALGRAHPATLVTSGHTHRHRRRHHGPVVVTEVGSTKDYPGTWAGYVVHSGGIRQVVRRVAAPDVLVWTDRSAAAAFGAWGRWSPGRLGDRCFSHRWP